MNIQTVKYNEISFLNVQKPQELEIKYLIKDFGFSHLALEDYLNRTQVPQIETYKDYALVVLDLPVIDQAGSVQQKTPSSTPSEKKENGNNSSSLFKVPLPQFYPMPKKRLISTAHINFFVGKNYLVVLHDGKLSQIDEIFHKCQGALKTREDFIGKGPVFLLYRIIDVLVDSSLSIINEISSTIDFIDKQLAESRSPQVVEEISATRRNIVVFQTMIKPIIPLFKQLEEGKHKELNGAMQPYWSNVLDHLQKIWERLEDNRELIGGISTSYESLLTTKTNEIVMVLTIFSAIILPLNLVASIYGMNIEGLPYAIEDFSFLAIMVFMVITSIVMLLIFRSRRWF